jgi:major membrane immunogen (membrane-anchored lipoprotein)
MRCNLISGASGTTPYLVVACLTLPILAACGVNQTSNRPTNANPYTAQIKEAAEKSKSEYSRRVLSDGVITRREYDDTVRRAVICAEKQGVKVNVTSYQGLNRYGVKKAATRIFKQCSEDNLALIEGLYTATIMNPAKEDIDELTARCLRKSKLAPASLTGRQLKDALAAEATDSLPFKTSDPRFDACMTNPTQQLETKE